ncbi:30S ribosomal protein S13 [Patescibacteria group bacterium]|nr:30S ribosomal protein S13 [Patescibacteria group bacterium]
MPRIAGIDLDNNKRVDIALTRLYGVGRRNVGSLLKIAGIDPAKRVKDLSEDEVNRVQKAIDTVKVEGELRAEVHGNIAALKQIASYRGIRHTRNLPVRGQRTKSNARTKRGKRVTIGAIKKEMAEKLGIGTAAAAPAAEAKK